MLFNITQNSSGIYCYENLINGKKYIGQSVNITQRCNRHENAFRKDVCPVGENKGLWNAVKKYGRSNFSLYVIEYASIERLDELEMKYIKDYDSHWTANGYNVYWGGNVGARGVSPSDATKDVLRKMFTGKNNPFYGKSHTEESNEKNRQAHLGRKNSASARAKMGVTKGTKKTKSTQYLGVTLAPHNKAKPWRAFVCIAGKFTHIGYFVTELLAALAYDKFVSDNNLSFDLNFKGDK